MADITAAVLNQFLEALNAPETLGTALTETEALDNIQVAERIKSALSAFQARRTAHLQTLRYEAEKARGIPASRRCKGLAAEVALARGDSAARGSQHLALATSLLKHMPNTLAALSQGQIHEEHAQAVTKETEWLNARHRRVVDGLITNDFEGNGPRKLGNIVREHAQRLDHKSSTKRLTAAEAKRRVYVKGTDNNMGQVTAILPLQQAVAVEQSLRDTATSMLSTGHSKGPNGERRTRDQIMADEFVARTTGQATAAAVPTQLHLVMTDDALFGKGQEPAWLVGHGPIPAASAKAWLANPDMEAFLRRVFTRPEDNQLVALDSRSRFFPQSLRLMVALRDDTCRAPYCDAQILNTDHTTAVKDGGSTHWNNASGLCGACNQIKENTGWKHTGDPESLTVTTPTGHTYTRRTRSLKPLEPRTEQPDATTEPPNLERSRAGPPRLDPASWHSTTDTITVRVDRLLQAA